MKSDRTMRDRWAVEPEQLARFVDRLHREWLAATGGMNAEIADAVARALLPAVRRARAEQTATIVNQADEEEGTRDPS